MSTQNIETDLQVVCLAGGVGGAKLAHGLAQIIPPENLTIIVNTGDDFVHCGLTICPDLDTVLYTLAAKANSVTGWGRVDESWQAMSAVRELGGPDWFNLGDLDLGLHLTRAHLLGQGQTLTHVTRHLCQQWGVDVTLLPMCDAPAPTTIISPDEHRYPFQEWFVKEKWQPVVQAVHLPDTARATPQVMQAIENSDVIIFAPSNPFVSLDPILNAYPVRSMITDLPQAVVAVSPIISGEAVKGPAAKLLQELGHESSAAGVARYFDDLLDGFVYDVQDADSPTAVSLTQLDLPLLCTDTMMLTSSDRARLAREVIDFVTSLL